MTGFGRAEAGDENHQVLVEVRSLNHRFREISIRLPRSLQELEAQIKTKVAEKVQRGKIDLSVFLDRETASDSLELQLNLPLIREYLRLERELREELKLKGRLTVDKVLTLPDAINRVQVPFDMGPVSRLLDEALTKALSHLDTMRTIEGQELAKDIEKRISIVGECLRRVEEKASSLSREYKKRLMQRVSELLESPLDEDRLEMEVAIIADRCDITEEIVRSKSHLSQLNSLLYSNEPMGRKAEFITQEIQREVTTMANKAQDALISQLVTEIKAELEKIREQLQNLE